MPITSISITSLNATGAATAGGTTISQSELSNLSFTFTLAGTGNQTNTTYTVQVLNTVTGLWEGLFTSAPTTLNANGGSFTLTGSAAGNPFLQSLNGTAAQFRIVSSAGGNNNNTAVLGTTSTFTVDAAAPVAPTFTGIVTDTGVVGDAITTDNTITLQGTAQAGSTVTIYVDGSAIAAGTATADANGVWLYTYSPVLNDGQHTFRATVTDSAGNVSASTDYAVTIDTQPPAAPAVATPLQFLNAAEAANGEEFTISGLTNGNTVTVTFVGTAIDSGTGQPKVITKTVPATDNIILVSLTEAELLSLGQGAVTISATQTDVAGNVSSASTPVGFTLDTLAPSVPVISQILDNVGTVVDLVLGGLTNDSTPTFSGTADAGTTIEVFAQGAVGPAVLLGTTTAAAGTGAWSFTPGSSLLDGAYTFYAVAEDAAGNFSEPSLLSASITIDTIVPGAPEHGSYDTLLNAVELEDGETFTFTATPGSVVTVTFVGTDGTLSDLVATEVTPGNFSLTLSKAQLQTLGDGPVAFTATDDTGLVQITGAPENFVIDTTAPAAPVVAFPLDVINRGESQVPGGVDFTINGNNLDTITVVFTGTEGTITKTATVNGPDATVTLSEEELLSLGQGQVTIAATATDPAGNVSPTATDSFLLDTIPPVVTISGIVEDTGAAGDGITYDNLITLQGTGQPFSLVNIYLDGATTPLGSATVDANGDWSFIDPNTLTSGPHTFSVTITGQNGNTSDPVTYDIVVDTTAPTGIEVTATGNPPVLDINGDPVTVGGETLYLYDIGDTITFTVTVNEPLVAGVNPFATLSNGATAVYDAANSTSTSLVFKYTVGSNPTEVVGDVSIQSVTGFTDIAGNAFVFEDDAAGKQQVICFYPGTLVATPDGERAVETLSIGDLVLTAEGEARPVRWMGRQTVSTLFGDAQRVLPIRIRAGALGENLPVRDLLVSPDHALLVAGVLVQAGALVNGSSIIRETAVPRSFTYHHIELADHSLVLAEGVAAETFVDSADRLNFDNWAEHEALYGHLPAIPEMALPRAKSPRQLPLAVRRLIAARAEALGLCLAQAA